MSIRRIVSLLLLAAYLPACTAYHQTDASVAQLTASPKPVDRIRVTKLDGTRVQIWGPRVALDSVIGMNQAPGKETGRVAIALADIQSLEVKEVDALMTGVGVVGTLVGISLVMAGLYELSCDPGEWC